MEHVWSPSPGTELSGQENRRMFLNYVLVNFIEIHVCAGKYIQIASLQRYLRSELPPS